MRRKFFLTLYKIHVKTKKHFSFIPRNWRSKIKSSPKNLNSCNFINRSCFCVSHKNRRKHNQHFKFLFFIIIDSHFVTLNEILTYRTLNLPPTSSIYLDFLPLEMQRRLTQAIAYDTVFFTLSGKKQPTEIFQPPWHFVKHHVNAL